MDQVPESSQSNEEIYLLVMNWSKQNGIIDLPFEFKRYLDWRFYGKAFNLDIFAYGRHKVGSIINTIIPLIIVLNLNQFFYK